MKNIHYGRFYDCLRAPNILTTFDLYVKSKLLRKINQFDLYFGEMKTFK